MSTNAKFKYPKDPRDDATYAIEFDAELASVDSVFVSESHPTSLSLSGAFSTPGDAASPTSLSVTNGMVGTTNTKEAWFRVSGGTPGKSYAIGASVTDVNGNRLFRSSILEVTGL